MVTSCPVCDAIKHRKRISTNVPKLKEVDYVKTVYEMKTYQLTTI
jgi:hypothetical protein